MKKKPQSKEPIVKNITILHTTSDTANFALGATAVTIGIVVALRAKKRVEKAVYRFVAGPTSTSDKI